ncbi:MAG: hypothetical protein DPW16_03570 [Chloroflexi bacterium]|nr:hypothetical protein [Chloroflexota bacterium]
MTLDEQVEEIQSQQDFILFVKGLAEDFKQNTDQWENQNISAYLEAIGAWVADMDGYYANMGQLPPQNPSWRLFGQTLLAAKFYE